MLGGAAVGSTVEGEEEEAAASPVTAGDTYTVLGTLSQEDAHAPDGVTPVTVVCWFLHTRSVIYSSFFEL